jgi:TATA-binding protein-associated factor
LIEFTIKAFRCKCGKDATPSSFNLYLVRYGMSGGQQPKSRLDRLLALLESGSAAVRSVAAKQIGEATKYHQDEQPYVIAKVSQLLRSKSWETRVAAGEAISAIAQFVPTFEQLHCSDNCNSGSAIPQPSYEDKFQFTTFDIRQVLQHGSPLLASQKDNADNEERYATMKQLDILIEKQQQIRTKIGLNGPTQHSFSVQSTSTTSAIDDIADEFIMSPTSSLNMGTDFNMENLSPSDRRKLNKSKRDAKSAKKNKKRPKASTSDDNRSAKKQKTESDLEDYDESIPLNDATRWSFHWLTERLRADLFDPDWEMRHGAAIGLREILKTHGASAGKTILQITPEEREFANQQYLEDICICVLCLFILDSFSDFVSDQVVAPVRETCAQILAIVLQYVSTDTVKNIVQCLIILASSGKWQVRHGGLIGMKYTIAIRLNDIDELLPLVLPAVISSIDDMSDDVRSVAAEALVPVVEHVIRLASTELKHIHDKLWDILLDLDDLSSATASIMKLLAMFYTLSAKDATCSAIFFSPSLPQLVPRLWPFLRHNMATVRKSAIETIQKLIINSKDCRWIYPLLRDLMCYVFQNIILEVRTDIVELSLTVWNSIIQVLPNDAVIQVSNAMLEYWIKLIATPLNGKMNVDFMVLPAAIKNAVQKPKVVVPVQQQQQPQTPQPKGRGGRRKSSSTPAVPVQQSQEEQKSFALRLSIDNTEDLTIMRINGGKAISKLCAHCSATQDMTAFFAIIQRLLDSVWGVHIQIAAMIIQESYVHGLQKTSVPLTVSDKLYSIAANNQCSYSEMLQLYNTLLADTNTFLEFIAAVNFDVSPYYTTNPATNTTALNQLPLEEITDIATRIYDFCAQNIMDTNARNELDSRKNRIQSSINRYSTVTMTLHTEVMACVSSAIVASGHLPEVVDGLIHALLESIEKEAASATLQSRSASALASLAHLCASRQQCPNQHIVLKLCTMLCANIPVTTLKPVVAEPAKGGKKKNAKKKQVDEAAVKTKEEIAHRGASLTLQFLAEKFGPFLFQALPMLIQATGDVLSQQVTIDYVLNAPNAAPEVINPLHILTEIAPKVHSDLFPILVKILEFVVQMAPAQNEQHLSFVALTIATLCKVVGTEAMKLVIDKLLPTLADPKNPVVRRGAVSVVFKIITVLDLDILPFIVFFVVPLLKRMSDQDLATRELASYCFGLVIKILPLERSAKSVPGFEEARERERKFIDQLLDNSKVEPFELPIHINAELRQYQKDGISWMAFLNKYNLHGILCDDMGLGKTLQTICMVASDIELRKRQFAETKNTEFIHMPSLVVCPATLVGHWAYEIEKFCPNLSIIQYTGNASQRKQHRDSTPTSDVVIISYDILRNDVNNIVSAQNSWNYCILDEGHIIKNKKSLITVAVKKINANHRLILSGTPIQNNVLELWSLFDFLMPGFLGTEKEFNIRYSKPIQASRDAKADSEEQATGTVALEALHRQVLPFLLRRVKEDVLHDLPEKIIQDCYCELTPLQQRLYEDFSKSNLRQEITNDLAQHASEVSSSDNKADQKGNVFQALQYLRKVCNHPCLVVNENHPQYPQVMQELNQEGLSLTDLSLSPKLLTLRQLLLDCGIGTSVTAENEQLDFMSQHRVLVFCQHQTVLDLIENELFKKHMPSVSYMRLDGTVEPTKRFGVVHKFNSDPTIDVLLLTTHVGGLGLNLTGADTVIFVEHDWNPAADLQAMDRAHRIGQKKVVSVYRIITKNTLEEKIMGLQHFKQNIAKSVMNTENANVRTMDTDQLVNLFQVSSASGKPTTAPVVSTTKSEATTELWEENQYEEFDLNSFLKKLK